MGMRPILVSTFVLLSASAGVAQSVNLEVAKAIKEFADDICGVYELSGERQETELKGVAAARVKGFVAKLAELGIEGSAVLKAEEYSNVRSEELGTELQDIRKCRRSVWEDMNEALIVSPEQSGALDRLPRMGGSGNA